MQLCRPGPKVRPKRLPPHAQNNEGHQFFIFFYLNFSTSSATSLYSIVIDYKNLGSPNFHRLSPNFHRLSSNMSWNSNPSVPQSNLSSLDRLNSLLHDFNLSDSTQSSSPDLSRSATQPTLQGIPL